MSKTLDTRGPATDEPASKRGRVDPTPYYDFVPDHLVYDIMEFIAAPEIGASFDGLRAFAWFGATCRRMRKLMETSAVWKQLNPGAIVDEMATRPGARSFWNLPCLVQCERMETHQPINPGVLSRMPNLKYLSLFQERTIGLADATSKLSHLVQLTHRHTGDRGEYQMTRSSRDVTAKMWHVDRLTVRGNLDVDTRSYSELAAFSTDGDMQLADIARLLPMPHLADLECTALTCTRLMATIRDRTMRLESLKILFAPPIVHDFADMLRDCFPRLRKLDLSGTITHADNLSLIWQLRELAELALCLGDDADVWPPSPPDDADTVPGRVRRSMHLTFVNAHLARCVKIAEAFERFGNSDGAPLRRVSIRGGGCAPLSGFFRGMRCTRLESVALLDRQFSADDGAALVKCAADTLLQFRVGPETGSDKPVVTTPPHWQIGYTTGLPALLSGCRRLRELHLALGRRPDGGPWLPVCESLRTLHVLVEHDPDWRSLCDVSPAFAYITQFEFGVEVAPCAIFIDVDWAAEFVKRCPNLVRVAGPAGSKLKTLLPARIERRS